MVPQEKFMRRAIEVAWEGINNGQTPFGAVIVKNDQLVVAEHNVVWATTDITAHAEIHAIRKACKKLNSIDLSGAVIYSTCEPCPMCFSACHWAKISYIVYGTSIADAQKIGFNELNISNMMLKEMGDLPIEVIGEFLRDESLKLFDKWEEKNSHRAY